MKKIKFDLSYPLYLAGPVMQGFGEHPEFYKKFGQKGHSGLDIGAVQGTPVLAMDDGYVRLAGDGGPEPLMGTAAGLCVLLTHKGYPEASGSYMTAYAHLSLVYVNTGDSVKRGDVLGLVGMTGAASGPHIHIQLQPAPLGIKNGYLGCVDIAPHLRAPVGTGKQ